MLWTRVRGMPIKLAGAFGRSAGCLAFLAGQVADQGELGAQWQASPHPRLGLADRGVEELPLADVLHGLVGRAGGGHRARVEMRIGELQHERHSSSSPTPGLPSATMAAWWSTWGWAASRNGVNAHTPGDTFRCPHAVIP